MIIIASMRPLAYVVPNLPSTVPVISIGNNFMGQSTPDVKLYEMALQRVRAHDGPLRALARRTKSDEKSYAGKPIAQILDGDGLAVDFGSCLDLRTAVLKELAFCSVNKLPR